MNDYDYISKIRLALDSQDVDQARDLLREALKENPSGEIYYLASCAALNEEQRVKFLEQAIEVDPFHKKAHEELQEKSTTLKNKEKNQSNAKIKISKKTPWRMVNTGFFLAVFMAPWVRACDSDINGYSAIHNSGTIAISSLLGSNESIDIYSFFLYTIIFLGLSYILIYCLLNIIIVINKKQLTSKPLYTKLSLFLLINGTIGLITVLYVAKSLGEVLMGYWLSWIGLVSSIWLEIQTYLQLKSATKK